MRALAISHTYVAEDNQVKWEVLSNKEDIEIELHLPHRWPSWESSYRPTPSKSKRFSTRVSRVMRAGKEDQYFFFPKTIRGLRNNFDILHVEQGSNAAVYFQALRERNRLSRGTKACFFTWINWEWTLRWPWTSFETYNLKNSEGAIGGNNEAVAILKKHGFRGKTEVIPQIGIDPDFFSKDLAAGKRLRKELGLSGIVIGFVGRLVEEKGIRVLLNAAKKLKSDISLLFVGGGPLEPQLHQEHHSLKIVHVPSVTHEKVRDYLRAIDIFVLPSFSLPNWKEQFGHVLIEAMSCEIPVIGSTSAAIPEVIGDSGILFSEKNADELAERLQSLIESEDERKNFGGLGRKRVLENFTHEMIGKRTAQFWRTL